jgi:hypothetical protein
MTGKRTARRVIDDSPEEPLIEAVKAVANPNRKDIEEEVQ